MGCMTSTSGTFVCRTTAKDMVATSPGSPTSSTGYALGLLSAKRRTSFFFFQAKDGIRSYKVTGVQTCALPIGVVYTLDAKSRLLGATREEMSEPRAATEQLALILARAVQKQLDATWGIGETGASGPTGNRYGDPPGHSCVGVAGPDRKERARTVETSIGAGDGERAINMYAFAHAALALLLEVLRSDR